MLLFIPVLKDLCHNGCNSALLRETSEKHGRQCRPNQRTTSIYATSPIAAVHMSTHLAMQSYGPNLAYAPLWRDEPQQQLSVCKALVQKHDAAFKSKRI